MWNSQLGTVANVSLHLDQRRRAFHSEQMKRNAHERGIPRLRNPVCHSEIYTFIPSKLISFYHRFSYVRDLRMED